MTVVNMLEAKTQLSKLVARAEAGEDVIIARDGRPAVRLTPVQPGDGWARRVAGSLKGQIVMSEDFDEPMPELEASVYGEAE
ncbi:MAG: type II toxin-antitoxin system prevent-host-death family antitoxin [Frankiaceae bacterium]|nr:type II toxin-antitoxin system prevent-host-death family antitoxin [Frankiaceae bacterium]